MQQTPTGRMKAIWKTVFLVALVSIFLIGLIRLNSTPDPVYEGKRIRQWLADLPVGNDETARSRAAAALKRAGAKAAPQLIRQLKTRNSSFGDVVLKYVPDWVRGRVQNRTDPSHLQAECASLLGYIHPTSNEIVSALINALQTGEPPIDSVSALALRRIASGDEETTRRLRQQFPELMEIKGSGAIEIFAVSRVVQSIRDAQATNQSLPVAGSKP